MEADPRTRGNFAYRSGERGNFKTDGMDPRRSASQWAQDVLSNIRTKQGRVRKWKLHNDRDRLGEEFARWSLEIYACARDLRLRMDPENGSGGRNRVE